jgi:hypothetical protein
LELQVISYHFDDSNIASISDSSCDVNLTEGEFNPMMAMMIKGPIGKLLMP